MAEEDGFEAEEEVARNLLRFTPAPSPQNVTGEKSLIDTYGEDVSMMVFMCFTVLLAGLMIVLALVPFDGKILKTARFVVIHVVFAFGVLLVILAILFWSEYDTAMCKDGDFDCCADSESHPQQKCLYCMIIFRCAGGEAERNDRFSIATVARLLFSFIFEFPALHHTMAQTKTATLRSAMGTTRATP